MSDVLSDAPASIRLTRNTQHDVAPSGRVSTVRTEAPAVLKTRLDWQEVPASSYYTKMLVSGLPQHLDLLRSQSRGGYASASQSIGSDLPHSNVVDASRVGTLQLEAMLPSLGNLGRFLRFAQGRAAERLISEWDKFRQNLDFERLIDDINNSVAICRICSQTADTAKSIIRQLRSTPLPQVTSSSDGELGLFWLRSDNRVELVFDPEDNRLIWIGKFDGKFVKGGDEPWASEVPTGLTKMITRLYR